MSQVSVQQLVPGDEVITPFGSAVFIVATDHPLYPNLRLVTWWMGKGKWSHDALDARQVVGEVRLVGPSVRRERLQAALLGDKR
jgi:hypothetical protein